MLALVAGGQGAFTTRNHTATARAATLQAEDGPKIFNVTRKSKKLIVTGENFAMGAVIMVDGKPQKTNNDETGPAFRLVAKKGAKKMADNAIVSITVQNPDGTASDDFGFFKGLTLTLGDFGKAIELEVGEKFLLILSRSPYKWTATVQNPSIVKLNADALPVMGAIGIFEAVHSGQTDLIGIGELACHNSNPPCFAPTLHFQVQLNVK